MPEDEVGKRYLTCNFMVKSLQFFNGISPTLHATSWHFIDLTRVCNPKQYGNANPKIVYSTVLKEMISAGFLLVTFFALLFHWLFKDSHKLNPYLFQNDVALHFELYWKHENEADIKFSCFFMLNNWAFQLRTTKFFSWLGQKLWLEQVTEGLRLTMACGNRYLTF